MQFNSHLERCYAEETLERWNEFCKSGSYSTFRRLEFAGLEYAKIRDSLNRCPRDPFYGDEALLREMDERYGTTVDEPAYSFGSVDGNSGN